MIFLGASKQEVLESTPRELWCYEDAHKMRLRYEDALAYNYGAYTWEAVRSVVGTMFGGKNKKPIPYPEKPHYETHNTDDLQKQRELFVAKLLAMQANFEINHGK